ncbi:MAG: hypothetical protein ACC662_03590, partial [Planctomycetota bacterium]
RDLVTGGSRLDGTFLADLDTVEVFDPETGSFTLLPSHLVHTRATHVMENVGGGLFALVGGSDVDVRAGLFDVATETFRALDAPAGETARFGTMGATFASGSLSVAGGDDRGTVLYLDAASLVVRNSGSNLSQPRAYGTATRIATDRILVVGGADTSRGFFMLHSVDLVQEGGVAGSRTFATEMRFPTPMVLHTATRLVGGRVLFCGGLNEDGGLPELDGAYLFTP